MCVLCAHARSCLSVVHPNGIFLPLWTDFHEILYLNIFRKFQSVGISVEMARRNGKFTRRPEYFYGDSLNFSWFENLSDKFAGEVEMDIL